MSARALSAKYLLHTEVLVWTQSGHDRVANEWPDWVEFARSTPGNRVEARGAAFRPRRTAPLTHQVTVSVAVDLEAPEYPAPAIRDRPVNQPRIGLAAEGTAKA